MHASLDSWRPVRGSKASRLMELQAAGFNVPEFVVSPTDLKEVVGRLGTPLVVRSSANVEDGDGFSFAGQFESFLNVRSVDQLEQAVQRCRDSVQSRHVAAYCRAGRIDSSRIRMDVIVQRMVRPDLAGVAFTVDPTSGEERVVIEACEGLAEELLSGRRPALAADHPLMRQHRPLIERTARAIQRHFGAPQDIEFAIERGTMHIVQARPITRITFAPGVGEWTNADFRDGGVSSGVCSPLMWSLYEFVWNNALLGTLRELKLVDSEFEAARMFYGRPYWNLGAVKHCVAKIPGFVEREFDADLNVQMQYDGCGARTPVTVAGVLRAIPTLLAVRSFLKRQQAIAEQWLGGAFAAIERQYEPRSGDPEALFQTLIERDYLELEASYFRTIFAASLAKLDLKRSFPAADFNALVMSLPALRHMEPVRAIRQAANRGENDITPILSEFRHHSLRGLDVRWPRWDEDRAAVEQLCKTMPQGGEADLDIAYERARANAVAKIPFWSRRAFRRKLDRLRHFIWLREEMRDLSSRMYYLIRRYALAIARRRGIGEDIFFMSFREIFTNNRSNVARNREVFESYRNFAAPNEIGARFHFCDAIRDGDLVGIAASGGLVQGTAHVARTMDEAMQIKTGEILVCLFTDPGWTPVLARAAGVVTETGGLLSHAAVICREFGIPAILGVAGATRRIENGMTITLNGNTGCVDCGLDARRLGETHGEPPVSNDLLAGAMRGGLRPNPRGDGKTR